MLDVQKLPSAQYAGRKKSGHFRHKETNMAAFVITRKNNPLFRTGIFLIVIALFVAAVAVYSVIRTVSYAGTYQSDATGVVTDCMVFHETDKNGGRTVYSDITISYEALNGQQRTIGRKRLPGEYKVGEQIALKCSEDHQNAVLESETHHQPIFLIAMFFLSVLFGLTGTLLITRNYNNPSHFS